MKANIVQGSCKRFRATRDVFSDLFRKLRVRDYDRMIPKPIFF